MPRWVFAYIDPAELTTSEYAWRQALPSCRKGTELCWTTLTGTGSARRFYCAGCHFVPKLNSAGQPSFGHSNEPRETSNPEVVDRGCYKEFWAFQVVAVPDALLLVQPLVLVAFVVPPHTSQQMLVAVSWVVSWSSFVTNSARNAGPKVSFHLRLASFDWDHLLLIV